MYARERGCGKAKQQLTNTHIDLGLKGGAAITNMFHENQHLERNFRCVAFFSFYLSVLCVHDGKSLCRCKHFEIVIKAA